MNSLTVSLANSFAIGAPSSAPRTDGLKDSPLDKLPVELIASIAALLPTQDKASFSLTCRLIHSTLSGKHFEELRDRRRQSARLHFLSSLARDRPNQIACFECKKIHNLDDVSKYYPGKRFTVQDLLSCRNADTKSKFDLRMHPKFSRVIFQHVMTQYRHDNPDPLPYSTYSEVAQLSYPADTKAPHTFRSSARIIDGSLILRTSWIFKIETNIFAESASPKLPLHLSKVHLCEHAREIDGYALHKYLSSLETNKEHQSFHTTNYHLRSCNFCKTEYRIDFKNYRKKFGPKQIAMFITKWEDLGSGPTHSKKWELEH